MDEKSRKNFLKARNDYKNQIRQLDSESVEIEKKIKYYQTEEQRIYNLLNAPQDVIYELVNEFEKGSSLNKTDFLFLFFATALQCVRQYVFSNEKFRLTDTEGDKAVKGTLKKMAPKSWEEILFGGVPYDIVERSDDLKNAGYSTGIGGSTHRYRTLGHDPVLGWLFGPINIISNSLTKTDIITTYSICNKRISGMYPKGTMGAFSDSIYQIEKDPLILPAAIAKQAIHFGADYFTKQGLPIPFMGTISPDIAQTMIIKYNIDMHSITRGMLLSSLINQLIICLYQFFYDEEIPEEIYKLKANKIVTYSNFIASSSNVIGVAISKDLKKLDVGGVIVTIKRIATDSKMKEQIRDEFVYGNYEKNLVLREYKEGENNGYQ